MQFKFVLWCCSFVLIHYEFSNYVFHPHCIFFLSFFLPQHEKALHALANALLEYETLGAEDIKRILLPNREIALSDPEEQQQQEEELVLA